jgi:2-haloacid dehalogenase
MEWHHAHDLGVPPEQNAPPLIAEHPDQADLIWAWTQRSEEMVGGPIEGSVEVLRSLKAAGVPCYALTNMESWTYPGRRQRYPFLRCFDGTVVSGFEGVAKPDPRVFELVLERFNLDPARTLFVDDSRVNVEAARGVRLRAVQFESPAQLHTVLQDAGLLAS